MNDRSERDVGARRIINQLAYRYEGLFDSDRIDDLFHDSYNRIAETARVTVFLPTLAEKLTVQRLDALAQAEGKTIKRVPEVLFVCVGNAGRSQMAAALTRHHAGTHLHIRTGGSDPRDAIHPEVVQAMAELGLSLDEEFPKPLTNEVLAAADVVITMGCGDSCPILPGKRYEDWPIDDPADQPVEQVRAIRDEVDRRVQALLAELIPAGA
ncbi:arsenate reductase ArsC [Amycolatopsis saalfeldensis]|uniref:Protein-tyrosine-phosphatase n=1 Tax=Amycolatopsis saalfeldensis TaxID=394193 RepID=A0A1H8YMQ2_9PSEU|nr:arsenate reductase ArsC [Amycolatopsis saalfeldensis]SEP53353.1 Protein-tyrosine-phosphatase [Amycolatopsis saalfeldensis]